MLSVNQRLREFGQFTVPAHAQGRGREPYPVRLPEEILEYFEQDPQASTRNAARRFGVSQWTVWNVLHQEGLHPYHFRPVQELGVNDLEPRTNTGGLIVIHMLRDRTLTNTGLVLMCGQVF